MCYWQYRGRRSRIQTIIGKSPCWWRALWTTSREYTCQRDLRRYLRWSSDWFPNQIADNKGWPLLGSLRNHMLRLQWIQGYFTRVNWRSWVIRDILVPTDLCTWRWKGRYPSIGSSYCQWTSWWNLRSWISEDYLDWNQRDIDDREDWSLRWGVWSHRRKRLLQCCQY